MAKWWILLKIMIACLSVLPVAVPIKSEEHRDVLAELELADLEPLNSDEANKSPEQVSEERKDPKQINTDNSYNYEEDANDDWYYDPEDMTEVYTGTTVDPRHRVPFQNEGAEDAEYEDRLSGTKTQIGAPEFEEGIVSKEDIHTKKVLQAPKGTIILYTAVVVILIAFIVLFSVWKNPFKNGRPGHQPPIVRTGEEGKRLLDHPFV